ncbi:MAG: AAA family ATPase, partial [Nitrososphaerales archaeon]
MKVEKIDLIGFRGLRGESFTLDDLTVFEGEMGIGKTSKLLSILFCLTGSSPHGLNLDELINSNTDSMRVRALITLNGEIYSLERKKRRRMPASFSIKPEDVRLPPLDIGIFIEGRQIADLFMGGPTERALKLDTLLGISEYDQRVSQLTPAAAERRISELEKQRERVDRTTQSIERLKEVDDRLMVLHKRSEEVKLALSSMETEYLHAKALL